MKRFVLGLTGVKGSGKTTAFEAIKEIDPEVFEITLAKKLKDECSRVFAVNREYFDLHEFKEARLDLPVYLSRESLEALLDAYGLQYDFTLHVKPHIGKILNTPRHIAQYVGTEVLRNVNKSVHLNAAYDTFINSGALVGIVTDIRFPDEYKFFKQKFDNFVLIYINNSFAEARCKDVHASESFYGWLRENADFQTKTAPLHDFREEVKNLYREIRKQNVC